jgi:HSP20 family protein
MFGLMPWRRERASVAPLARWEEAPFHLLRREMDTLLDRVFGPELPWGLDVEVGDREVVVRAEAPGFEPAELELNLTGDTLTIRAEHAAEKGKEGESREERRFMLKRTLTVPPGIDVEKVAATYRNGVLEVHLPLRPEAVGRRIEVRP